MPYAKINSEKFKGHKISNPPDEFIWEEKGISLYAKPLGWPMLSTHMVMRSDYSRILIGWAESIKGYLPPPPQEETLALRKNIKKLCEKNNTPEYYDNLIWFYESAPMWNPLCEMAYPITQLIGVPDKELSRYFSLWKDSTQKKLQLDLKNLSTLIKQCKKPGKEVWVALRFLTDLEKRYLEWQTYLQSLNSVPTHLKAIHLQDLIFHLESFSLKRKTIKSILADLLKACGFLSPVTTARNILDSPMIKVQ
jgi:hypothetical protein